MKSCKKCKDKKIFICHVYGMDIESLKEYMIKENNEIELL